VVVIICIFVTMKNTKNILRVRKWQEEQKKKGLCIECSNPTNGLRCNSCNARRQKLRMRNYYKWIDEGKCHECGKESIKNKSVCEKHYLMKVSLKRLGSSKHWQLLKTLLEKQDFKCGLTTDVLSLENDIELDHIIPTSRSGTNDISNVRWVTKEANRLKQNLTDNELKELCNKILQTI